MAQVLTRESLEGLGLCEESRSGGGNAAKLGIFLHLLACVFRGISLS